MLWNSEDYHFIQVCPQASEKRLDTLTQAKFTVKGNHLVLQVQNATAVRYTKHNGGYKSDDQSYDGTTYFKVGSLTAEALVLTRLHLRAFHVKG